MNGILQAIMSWLGRKDDGQVKGVQAQAPIPTSTPIPTPSPTPTLDQFTFDMGKNNYAYLKPQIDSFYQGYNNPPLSANIDDFIKAGEKYGVDPRILVAIGHNESSSGKNYPVDSNNPFGYVVEPNGDVVQGLKNAGFTSIPHAIDRLTYRFSRDKNRYPEFLENPNIDNLQRSYNATDGEREGYLKNLKSTIGKMRGDKLTY